VCRCGCRRPLWSLTMTMTMSRGIRPTTTRRSIATSNVEASHRLYWCQRLDCCCPESSSRPHSTIPWRRMLSHRRRMPSHRRPPMCSEPRCRCWPARWCQACSSHLNCPMSRPRSLTRLLSNRRLTARQTPARRTQWRWATPRRHPDRWRSRRLSQGLPRVFRLDRHTAQHPWTSPLKLQQSARAIVSPVGSSSRVFARSQ
jgi:hypothetical protein